MKSEIAKVQKVAVETLRLVCKRLTGLIPVMMLAFVSCEKEEIETPCLPCNEMLPFINETLDYLNATNDGWHATWYDGITEEKLSFLADKLMEFPGTRNAYVFSKSLNIRRYISLPRPPAHEGAYIYTNPFVSEIAIEFDDVKVPQKILRISMQEPWTVDGFEDLHYKTYSNSNSDPAKAILGKWEMIAYGVNGKIHSNRNFFPGYVLEFLPNGVSRVVSYDDSRIVGYIALSYYRNINKSSKTFESYQVSHFYGSQSYVSYAGCAKFRFFDEDKLEIQSCVSNPPDPWYHIYYLDYFIYQREN